MPDDFTDFEKESLDEVCIESDTDELEYLENEW